MQVDDLDAVEAFAHHLTQARIGAARDIFAIGDEGHHGAPRRILALEQLPQGPAPEGHRKFGKGVEFAAPARIAHGRFQIVPEVVHPVADQLAHFARRQTAIGWIAENGEYGKAALDLVRLAALLHDLVGSEAQPPSRRRRAGARQRVGQIDADPLVDARKAQRMAQAIMGDRIGANENFKAENAFGQRPQGAIHRARPRARLHRAAHMFDHAEQKGAGACRGVKQLHLFIGQAAGAQVVAQRPVDGRDHIGDHIDGRVIDAEPPARFRIEHPQKVFVEIKDRVRLAGGLREDGRIETVDRVDHHLEADANFVGDLLLAQHAQDGAQQGMIDGHVPPRGCIHRPALRFAHQQKAEGEGLREGRCKERVEMIRAISGGFGMGVDDIAKFIAHPLQRRICAASGAQLAQFVLDDAAHQTRRMGEIGRKLVRIARRRWGGDGEQHEGCGEAIRIAGATNGAFGICVGGRGVERPCGYDLERIDQFAAVIDAQAHEIGDGPDRQRLKPLVLALVMGVLVAGGIVGLVGRL